MTRLFPLAKWAQMNGIPRRTANYWAHTGRLPCVRFGQAWFLDLDQLEADLRRQRREEA